MGEVYNKLFSRSTIRKIAGRLFVFSGLEKLERETKDLDPEIHEIVNRRFWDMVS